MGMVPAERMAHVRAMLGTAGWPAKLAVLTSVLILAIALRVHAFALQAFWVWIARLLDPVVVMDPSWAMALVHAMQVGMAVIVHWPLYVQTRAAQDMAPARAASAFAIQASQGHPAPLSMEAATHLVDPMVHATQSRTNVSVRTVPSASHVSKRYRLVRRTAINEACAWMANVCVALDGEVRIVAKSISNPVRSHLRRGCRKLVAVSVAVGLV